MTRVYAGTRGEVPLCSKLGVIHTRQSMYVQRNSGARAFNHCCSRKAISITYYVCVYSLWYPADNAPYILICGMSSPKIFFPIVS